MIIISYRNLKKKCFEFFGSIYEYLRKKTVIVTVMIDSSFKYDIKDFNLTDKGLADAINVLMRVYILVVLKFLEH